MKWRDKKDLQSDIIAQKRNLGGQVDYSEISSVQQSEFVSEVQQWVTRTKMRSSVNGRAKGTEILFLHSEASVIGRKLENEVFPGLRVELSNAEIPTAEHQREERVLKAVEYLRSTDTDKISTRDLKKQVGLINISKEQWKTVSGIIDDSLVIEWERCGRSWVKAEDFPPGLIDQDKIINNIGI